MFRFTKTILLIAILALLAACGGTGSISQRQSYSSSARSPVPISAAQQSDFKKALSLMKKEEYEKAIPILEGILAENDRLPGTHINLAIAYMALPESEEQAGHYEKAERSLLKAVETNTREPVAHFQLGLLYRKTGRFEQAKQSYEQAIRINSAYAMAHFNLGILCDIYLQQAPCAVQHFESYLKLVPDDAEKVGLWLTDIRRRAGIVGPTTAYEGEQQ